MIISEHGVIDIYRGQARTIRVQRCMGCNGALAVEAASDIGFDGEYWIVDSALKNKGQSEHYFKRSPRWFGNYIQCPSCGRNGQLPQDKPLNWDTMVQQEEVRR